MLAEYARYPYFGTVGIDSSFYRPPEPEMLEAYAAALPAGFPCVSKVWDRLTIHTFGRAEKSGTAGERNPHFLDAELFVASMLEPYRRHFADHMGPFVFELQSIPRAAKVSPDTLATMLDAFFDQLPRDARYAVEIRNAEFLTPAYFAVLREHDVAHCFNSWTHMPSIGEQLDLEGSITAPFTVCRALMRPGRTYADSREAFDPFDCIRDPQPEVRADIVRLAKATLGVDGDAYILVNNRLEGCSPLTVAALADAVATASTASQIARASGPAEEAGTS